MNKILLAALLVASFSAVAGNCTYPDDIASDGSICGGRAASVRAGGEVPPPEYVQPVSDNSASDTYVQKADCTNGYSVMETTVMTGEEPTQIIFMHSGKVVAQESGTSASIDSTTDNVDGINSTTNSIARTGNLNSGTLKFYTLAYEFNRVNFNAKDVNKGVIIINKDVVAQCTVSMISGD